MTYQASGVLHAKHVYQKHGVLSKYEVDVVWSFCRHDCQAGEQVQASDAHRDAGGACAQVRGWPELAAGGQVQCAAMLGASRPAARAGSPVAIRSGSLAIWKNVNCKLRHQGPALVSLVLLRALPSTGLDWYLCLAAGETLLAEAVQMSVRSGLVRPNDHIVVVQVSDLIGSGATRTCPPTCHMAKQFSPKPPGLGAKWC